MDRETMFLHWRMLCLGLLCVLADVGCDRGDASVAQRARLHAGADVPRVVAVQAARLGAIAHYYESFTHLDVKKKADVVSRVIGVIEELLVEEGDEVVEGTPVLKIGNNEYLHRVEKTVANRENRQAKHDRIEEMWKQNLVSLDEYDTAKNDLAIAKADEALAKLNLGYTVVRAPFAGTVTHRYVDVGQKVGLDSRLFTIADFRPLLARVPVPSKVFKQIQPNQSVELVLDSNGQRLEGRITLVSPVIDSLGQIKVTLEVEDYPPGTRPGDFANVLIVTQRKEQTTLVPIGSVITEDQERVVYIASKDRAVRRVVEVGLESDVHAEILSGVRVGDSIVTKGQRSLKDGSLLKVFESDLPSPDPGSDNVGS